MQTWTVVLIILLVLGVIASNILLLRYTAKMKLPDTFRSREDTQNLKNNDEEKKED